MLLQQSAEVEDLGFIRNPIQMKLGKLAQNCGFIEGLFPRRVAVAEPALHQMLPAT